MLKRSLCLSELFAPAAPVLLLPPASSCQTFRPNICLQGALPVYRRLRELPLSGPTFPQGPSSVCCLQTNLPSLPNNPNLLFFPSTSTPITNTTTFPSTNSTSNNHKQSVYPSPLSSSSLS